jgi:26S proteasome regulatory subunit N3
MLRSTDRASRLLLAAQSTAFLRHDEDLQATLINCLLRNYFNSRLYDQADKLVSKVTWPESAGNPQSARYLFYLGRVRAIQLNYSSSHECLLNAVRRAPAAHVAPGFYQTVHKYFIVVELLMGDIPDRALFRQPVLRKALVPYFQIVQGKSPSPSPHIRRANISSAVRVGDLEAFQTALNNHSPRFHLDGTYSLILRLRHNVIKTALRMISLAYSRISLKDICLKLHLDSEEDTEYIVAKAIRDGVIDAEVDHENGWMKSTEVGDLYGTDEPRKRFQARIDYCNQLHNESVKVSRPCQYAEDTANLLVIGDAISPQWPETRYVVFPSPDRRFAVC